MFSRIFMGTVDCLLCYFIHDINKRLCFTQLIVQSRFNYLRKLMENTFFLIQLLIVYYFNKSKLIEIFLIGWIFFKLIPILFKIIISKRNTAELLFIGERIKKVPFGNITNSIEVKDENKFDFLISNQNPDAIIVDKMPRKALRNILIKSGNKPVIMNDNFKSISLKDVFKDEKFSKNYSFYKYSIISQVPVLKKIIKNSGIKVVNPEKADYILDLNCMFGVSSQVFTKFEKNISIIKKTDAPFLIFVPIEPISSTDAILYRSYEAIFSNFERVKIIRIPFLVTFGVKYLNQDEYTLWSHLDSIFSYIQSAAKINQRLIELPDGDYLSSKDVVSILEKLTNL